MLLTTKIDTLYVNNKYSGPGHQSWLIVRLAEQQKDNFLRATEEAQKKNWKTRLKGGRRQTPMAKQDLKE